MWLTDDERGKAQWHFSKEREKMVWYVVRFDVQKKQKKNDDSKNETIYNQLNFKYVCDKRHNVTMCGTVL